MQNVTSDATLYLSRVVVDGSLDTTQLDQITARLDLENLLAWIGKCFDACVTATATHLDRDGARDALKAVGLSNGNKDIDRMAEVW